VLPRATVFPETYPHGVHFRKDGSQCRQPVSLSTVAKKRRAGQVAPRSSSSAMSLPMQPEHVGAQFGGLAEPDRCRSGARARCRRRRRSICAVPRPSSACFPACRRPHLGRGCECRLFNDRIRRPNPATAARAMIALVWAHCARSHTRQRRREGLAAGRRRLAGPGALGACATRGPRQ